MKTAALSFVTRLSHYLRAGYPCVAIETSEEPRAIGDIAAASKLAPVEGEPRGLATWSATEGLRVVLPAPREIQDTADLLAATQAAQALKATTIILRDAQAFPWDRDPVLARSLRDLIAIASSIGSTVVLLGAKFPIYPSIEKLVTTLDYTLPSPADLAKVVASIGDACGLDADLRGNGDVLRALSGLSVSEAENALALSYIESGSFDVTVLYREKLVAVKKSGLLEIVEADPRGLASLGGLASLKSWTTERRAAYSDEARAYGLPAPKGCLIVGVPGTGKSLAAKALGFALNVPTLKLDIGALFGSLVGESERRCREALALAEAMAPCVLWLDEVDKGLAGAGGSGSGDSGTAKRVFGTILSWLQERKSDVFMVATANDVSALPPEFFRRGRWDEIWSVDLPTTQERVEIIEVQVAKHVKSAKAVRGINYATIAEATTSYTGAELESCVIGALFRAYADGARLVTTADVVETARTVVPLAVMAKAQVDGVRAWAKQNARNAGSVEVQATSRKIS